MAYSELVKDFEKIRAYMRDFFVYGFRTRMDFDRKSARSYDNERRRVESWLGDAMSFRQDASGKSVFISVDSRNTLHNPLYKALKAKSFTDKDITLHFYILDVLAEGEKLPVKVIAERIAERCQEISPDFLPDDSTVRNKLKEYVSLGLLKMEKQGRELLYFRADTCWNMEAWKEALCFASEAMPLGVTGSWLLDKYPSASGIPDYFSFKHHYLLGAMDSDVLSELLSCRKEKKCAKIVFSTRRGGETFETLIYPLKLYISTRNGREYLMAYNFRLRRPRIYRLDRILSVQPADVFPGTDNGSSEDPRSMRLKEAEQLDQAGARFAEHLWGVSSGRFDDRELKRIEMRIRVEEDEDFIVGRLQREKRNGTVTQLDEHTWQFAAEVLDALEMLPWIRTFTGRIVQLECSDPQVTRWFYGDLAEMYEMYGLADPDAEQKITGGSF